MKAYKAYSLARRHHKDQLNKYNGEPYLDHLARVAEYVEELGFPGDYVAAAWLHDILEDTEFSAEELWEQYKTDPHIFEAVDLLTHRHGKPYQEYVALLKAGESYPHQIARVVKIADNFDNLNRTLSSDYLDKETKDRLKAKYSESLLTLDGSLWMTRSLTALGFDDSGKILLTITEREKR